MKILYVTTIGATMSFFQDFIEELINDGHTVDIATNDSIRKTPECFERFGSRIFSLPCSRSPLNIGNWKSVSLIRELVKNEKYDIVHCHTPVAAACTRIACRKLRISQKVKVFYTAHGFHFYKGAPKKNWMLYYPIEKICARFTDKLITINNEDYELAKNKLKASEVCYVPGVGIDISKFEDVRVDRNDKRKEIGVPEKAFLILSVGELNKNKNHQIIIKALATINDSNIHYVIAGIGDERDYLLELSRQLGINEQIHLIGYRNDIQELNSVADAFCFPSFREGLSVSLMEAMACGLPVICSEIRGNTDLINTKGGFLFNPHYEHSCERALRNIVYTNTDEMGRNNQDKIKDFSLDNVVCVMKNIYGC